MPAASRPVPAPTQSASGAGASRCISSAADVVLPMPISPIATMSVPASIASATIDAPRARQSLAPRGKRRFARGVAAAAPGLGVDQFGMRRDIRIDAGIDHLHVDAGCPRQRIDAGASGQIGRDHRAR